MDAITLADGRRLGLALWGTRGRPVVWLGGAPSSRLSRPVESVGARMITLERPGYGISTPRPGAQLVDFADDVRQALDALAIDRAVLMGYSGGGPYALACASRLGERLERVVVLGGVGPLDAASPIGVRRRVILRAAAAAPWLVRAALRDPRRDVERFYGAMIRDLSPLDRAVIARPGPWKRQITQTREAFAQGTGAFVDDLARYGRDWGFRLEDVHVPVDLWYGEDDRSTPAGTAAQLAARLPIARVFLLPDEGHFFPFDEPRGGLERVLGRL